MEVKEGLIPINIQLAGRAYPLKIKAEDESAIRNIAREINDRVTRYQLQYPHKDKQDALSIVLLTLAVELYRLRTLPTTPTEPPSDLIHQIQQLEKLLETIK